MSDPTAFWAAVAAGGAAIAALATAATSWAQTRYQRFGYRNSIKPELDFEGWEYSYGKEWASIRIPTVRNHGKGGALNVTLSVRNALKDARETYYVHFGTLTFVPPSETKQLDAEIHVCWPTMPDGEIRKTAWIGLDVACLDSDGNEHRQSLILWAKESGKSHVAEDVLSGLSIQHRSFRFLPAWRVRWRDRQKHRKLLKESAAKAIEKKKPEVLSAAETLKT